MAKPIVRALLAHDHVRVVVSFHSPSGYEQVHFNEDNIAKIYLPLDLYSNQKQLVELLKPSKVLFIKYEFWFNLLRVLNDRNIDYYYSSLHLNEASYLFSTLMTPFLNLIKAAKHIYCHNQEAKDILTNKGILHASVLGDTRISQAIQNAETWTSKVSWQRPRGFTIAIGSMTKKETPSIVQLVQKHKDWNFMIAPHDLDELDTYPNLFGESIDYYSKTPHSQKRVMILDTMGDLRYMYGYCDMAYVGGGFEKGPHNVLEPLVYGMPVLCGPAVEKFPMARALHHEGLLTLAQHLSDLSTYMSEASRLNKDTYQNKVSMFFEKNKEDLSSIIKELV